MSKLVITLVELTVLSTILSRFLLFKISIKQLLPGRVQLLVWFMPFYMILLGGKRNF